MSNIKSWLDNQIENAKHDPKAVVVGPRHNIDELVKLTKKEVIAYAQQHDIKINSRKKKEELIEIIIRS